MGFGNYHEDVRTAQRAIGTTRQSDQAFQHSDRAKRGEVQEVHADLDVKGKIRECCDSPEHPKTTPIVVAMDVTKSRGRDARAIYEQVPSFLGSVKVSGVVPDPQIMWAAIGDANCDRASVQIGQFESDRRIDADLARIWMEEGGGGTGEESYELIAYYLAHRTKLDSIKRGKRGFVFFTGDEAPYPAVSKEQVKRILGIDIAADVPSEEVFRALQEKFSTFLIFPRSSMEDRSASIDEEIKQRLIKAGGRFKDIDIRASLIWDTRDDLDLHCLTPDGFHIYYGSKRAHCGGELDVDRNVHGEDPKPVENIRWAKGDAPSGKYVFWVELYRRWETQSGSIPFRVELDVNGEIKTIEGKVSRQHGEGKFEVASFSHTPPSGALNDRRAAYSDEVILSKWGRYIPTSNILRIQDPASAVEVMLGVMALTEKGLKLDAFAKSMRERQVPKSRQDDVISALSDFSRQGVFSEVSADVF